MDRTKLGYKKCYQKNENEQITYQSEYISQARMQTWEQQGLRLSIKMSQEVR